MFIGKFNFGKVCSNVFSPAFRDLPRQSEKTAGKAGRPRPSASLAAQNSQVDRQTSDFAERATGKRWTPKSKSQQQGGPGDSSPKQLRGRPKAAGGQQSNRDLLEGVRGMKRGISADPHASGKLKAKAVIEVTPDPSTSSSDTLLLDSRIVL